MRKIIAAIAGGALIGAFALSHAKLPAPPPQSEAEKAAAAQKAAAANAKAAELLDRARDKAAANYRKNRAASMAGKK